MKTLKKILVLILITMFTQGIYAQTGTLTGSIGDEQGEPVPFANVSVLRTTDSTMVTGAVAEIDGSFEIPTPKSGEYFIRYSVIGFATAYSELFDVDDESFKHDFGIVKLEEETGLLEEVTVRGIRPQIKMEADKMVVRVEGTAMSSGSTAYEVLSKSPGVWADQDGNFQINGRQGVMVMIDGRPTYLSNKELKTLLEGLPAENITDIEIVTNPSAKHDAEGTGGILNINLKKNTLTGINGSIYGGYHFNQLHLFNGGVNLNHKKGKWNSFANLEVAERGYVRDMQMDRQFVLGGQLADFEQYGQEIKRKFIPSVRLGTDFDFNDRHSIGVTANLSYQNHLNTWDTHSNLRDYGSTDPVLMESNNTENADFTNGAVNLHYAGLLDTAGTKLSVDVDYVRLNRESHSNFLNRYFYSEDSTRNFEHLGNQNVSVFDIYAARVDLIMPLSESSTLEIGAKASRVISDNDLIFYDQTTEERRLDEEKSNHFIYDEKIFAIYTSFNTRLNDTWTLQGGLRAEKTVSEGQSQTLEESNKRNYLDLFPSFLAQQKISDQYQLTYSYNRRISRPEYERLNPSIFYLDPYTYIEGNPFLVPQYTHNIQVTQTFLQNYNLVLGYDHTVDFIGEIPLQDPETMQTSFGVRNLDRFKNYNATIVAPVQVVPAWSMINNVVMSHQEYSTVLDERLQKNKQFFFLAQSNHQILLPHDFKLEVNATYRGPLAYGLYQLDSQWWVDAGVKKSIMGNKMDISMNVTDIFKSMQLVGSSEINGNTTYVDQYLGNRGIRLSLRYNFNKGGKFEQKSRGVNLEELNRAGEI